MIDLILIAIFFTVGGLLVLLGFVIWTFRDAIGYVFEILGYVLQSVVKVAIQGGVALVVAVDEWLDDYDIAEEPLWRAAIVGAAGFLLGMLLILLLSVILGQSWMLVTLSVVMVLAVAIGLLADPEKDWSLGSFPSFPWRNSGGGPGLPLNL